MFDLAWGEIFVIGLVAVLVLGPKELPQAMRTFAKALRKVRNLGSEFQGHFNEMLREAELDEVRKQVQKFSQTSLTEHVTNYIDPKGEISKEVQSTFQDPDAPLPAANTEPVTNVPGAPEAAAVEAPAMASTSETAEAETAAPKPPAAI
jgi:sec-independent protein translocase protein TatB